MNPNDKRVVQDFVQKMSLDPELVAKYEELYFTNMLNLKEYNREQELIDKITKNIMLQEDMDKRINNALDRVLAKIDPTEDAIKTRSDNKELRNYEYVKNFIRDIGGVSRINKEDDGTCCGATYLNFSEDGVMSVIEEE